MYRALAAKILTDAGLRMPWPVDLLQRVGVPLDPADPPRTTAQVARLLC